MSNSRKLTTAAILSEVNRILHGEALCDNYADEDIALLQNLVAELEWRYVVGPILNGKPAPLGNEGEEPVRPSEPTT